MKKTKFLWSMLSMVMAAMLSVQFTSCSKDDKDSVSVSMQSVNFSENGGSQSVSISSNTSWSISGMQSWVTVSPAQGTKDGSITINANPNTTGSSRNCTLIVTAGSASTVISISQNASGNNSGPNYNQVTVTNNSTYSLTRFRIVFLNSRNETLTDIDCGTLSPGKKAYADIPTSATQFYMATYLYSKWFFSPNYDIQYNNLTLSTDEVGGWKSNSSSPKSYAETFTDL